MDHKSIFHLDFFPTGRDIIINNMLFGLDISGKVILEPHGGKGDMINVLKEFEPKSILSCEKQPELALITANLCDRFLGNDFLEIKKEDISHVDFIFANPPFSNQEHHIKHMIDIAPDNCTIVTLFNYDSLYDNYRDTTVQREVKQYIKSYGSKQELGNVFSTAERKTECNIGLIVINVPGEANSENEFEGYFDYFDDNDVETNDGLMTFNDIENIVHRYVGAVKMFDSVIEMTDRMESVIGPIGAWSGISFGAFMYDSQNNMSKISRETFKIELQKSAWRRVFSLFDMSRFVTSNVREDINKFVELNSNVPFTVKNIYKMVDIIFQSRENNMNKTIVKAFDNITKYYDENRYQKEGWKTNSEYVVNKKFILPYMCEVGYDGSLSMRYSSTDYIDDLFKALYFVTGVYNDSLPSIRQFMEGTLIRYDSKEFNYIKENDPINLDLKTKGPRLEFGKWYEYGFFKIKAFKKGTMHFEFLDPKVWEAFNRTAAKAKGFQLASKFTSDFRKKKTGVEKFKETLF